MRYVLGSSIIEAAVIRFGTFCVVGHDCWACLGCLGVTPARWSVGLLPNLGQSSSSHMGSQAITPYGSKGYARESPDAPKGL